MASNYKSVEYNSTGYEERTYHKKQNLSNLDTGISSIQFRSESIVYDDDSGPISYTTSGSHYHFIRGMLFDSSSFHDYPELHTHKLNDSGSIIYIPQQYYGEEIKPESFQLNDLSVAGRTIRIKDDGKGNLYSINAVNSRSAASHASSSDNYVGNIHYQQGVVVITETGSWSGSGAETSDFMYTDIGTGGYNLSFQASQCLYENEIVLHIEKNEFLATTNGTIWSGSSHRLIPAISKSLDTWTPYATSIAFYDRVPNLINSSVEFGIDYDVVPGVNRITWGGADLEIQSQGTTAIPMEITSIKDVITGEIVNRVNPAEEDVSWVWTYNPMFGDYLKHNNPYEFTNSSGYSFVWGNIAFPEQFGSVAIPAYTPLMVAHFPRPVKIDDETDLTIIIRYDT